MIMNISKNDLRKIINEVVDHDSDVVEYKIYLKYKINGDERVYFGPFPNIEAASRAFMFSMPQDEFFVWRKSDHYGIDWWKYTPSRPGVSVGTASDGEIDMMLSSPDDWEISKLTMKSPGRVTVHPSWNELLKKWKFNTFDELWNFILSA